MKRSEINKALKELEAMCAREHCYLPPFCNFTPEEWRAKGHEYDEVRDCMLGWDITDYGLGDFDKVGMSLITIRNGNRKMADKYPKVYAEKLLYMKEGQYSPNHFHWYKTEDIINRGGGNILIRVYNSLPDESIDRESDVTVHCDGRTYTVAAGTQVRLTPGESIHIQQYMYHDFEVESGTGPVLLGEVSQCNDDNTDNRFNPPVGRFPKIEEDEAPYRLLCNEYPKIEDGGIMKITEEWVNVSHSIGAPFGGIGTGYGVLGKFGFVLPNFNSTPCVGKYDRFFELPNYDYLDLHGNDCKNFLHLHIKDDKREYAFQSEALDDTAIPADTLTSYSFLPFAEHVAEYNKAGFRVGMLAYSPLIAYDVSESSIPALCMEICITNQSDREMALDLSFALSEQHADGGMKVGFADGGTVCKVQLKPGERAEVLAILAWYYPEFQTPSAVMTELYRRYYTLRFDSVDAVWQYALEHREQWKQRMLRWQASFECPAEFKRLWFSSLASVITSTMLSADPYFFEIESPHPYMNTMDVTIYSAWLYMVNWPEIEKMDMYTYREAIPASGEDQGLVWHSLWTDRSDYVEEPCYLTRIYRDYLWFNDKKFLKDMQRPVQDALNRIYKQKVVDGLVESKLGNQSYDLWKMPGFGAYVNTPWLYALYSVIKMNAALGSNIHPGDRTAEDVLEQAKQSFIKYLWDEERGYFRCFYRTEGSVPAGIPESVFTDQFFGRWLLLIERDLDALLPMEMIRKSTEYVYRNNLIDDPEHDFRGWSNGRLPDGVPCMDHKQYHAKTCWIGAQLNMGSLLGELGDEAASMDVFTSLEHSLHNNHLAVGEWNQSITEDAKSCLLPEEPSKDTPRFPPYPRYKCSWEYLIRILGLKMDEEKMELRPFRSFDFAIHDVMLAGCRLNVTVQKDWDTIVVDGARSEKAVFDRRGHHSIEFCKDVK